jgi:hypothetical protein
MVVTYHTDDKCSGDAPLAAGAPMNTDPTAVSWVSGYCSTYFQWMPSVDSTTGALSIRRTAQAATAHIESWAEYQAGGNAGLIIGASTGATCAEVETAMAAKVASPFAGSDECTALRAGPAAGRRLSARQLKWVDGKWTGVAKTGTDGAVPYCNGEPILVNSEMIYNMGLSTAQCDEAAPGTGVYVKMDIKENTCAADWVAPAKPAPAVVAVEISMTIEIDVDMSEDEFASAMTGVTTDPVVVAFKAALTTEFAKAMNLPAGADVTIISIKFVAGRRLTEKLGAGKKMVVEFEVSGVNAHEAAAVQSYVTSNAAAVTGNLGTGLNAAIAADTTLAAAVSAVEVDATITAKAGAPAAAPAAVEEDSTSGASSIRESAAVLLGAAALSVAMF